MPRAVCHDTEGLFGDATGLLSLSLQTDSVLKTESVFHLRLFRRNSKQCLELIDRKPRIFDDSTHSKRLDWIVARDSQHPLSVIHYDMLALPDYPKPPLFRERGLHQDG